MTDFIAIITLMVWPFMPLFWIPIHGLPKIFKRLGFYTYIMPLITWLPLAYLIYQNRLFLLQFRIDIPLPFEIFGVILLVIGTLLHIWTGKLLSLWGLIGLPEVSRKAKGKLMAEGPFSFVRHPTYLAHTSMFLGIFLMTEVVTIGILTFLDFIVAYAIIIPLEEKELLSRFGKDYAEYMKRVPYRFFPYLRG